MISLVVYGALPCLQSNSLHANTFLHFLTQKFQWPPPTPCVPFSQSIMSQSLAQCSGHFPTCLKPSPSLTALSSCHEPSCYQQLVSSLLPTSLPSLRGRGQHLHSGRQKRSWLFFLYQLHRRRVKGVTFPAPLKNKDSNRASRKEHKPKSQKVELKRS